MRVLSLLLFLAVALAACSSDSDNTITGPYDNNNNNNNGGGVVETVRFSTQVAPIFAASCSGSGCHNPGAQSGVRLGTWSQVTSSVGQRYGGPIVLPGNAAGSPLIDKLGSTPRFGVRMPDGGGALSSAQIQTIATWINEGALNN
ncbi:MAG: hypothetical protein O3C45_07600 [Bacteroidetes bacterium]|nr:hypothetical protein [Bacteroidota bacterium]MDA0874913.1 hypothetical protein [Bacteroidota bacterium]